MLNPRLFNIASILLLLLIIGCTSKEERVAKYFEDGLALIEQKNYPKAVIAFKNVLQIRPKYAEARFQLGKAEEKQENWRAAFGNYRAAVDFSKTLIPPRIRLGELYLLANRSELALEMANEVVSINPSNPGGLALRGRLFSLAGENEKAMDSAKKAFAIDPSHVAAVALLSSLLIQQGEEAEGIAILEEGVALNQNNISLKLILSKKYAVVKQNDKAAALLQKLIEIEPNMVLHRVRKADFQTSIGQFEAAETTLRKAIEDNADNANLKLVLSNFLMKRRGGKSAEEALQQFIAASPDEHVLRFGLAKLYNQQQEREKLVGVYESIIALASSEPAKLKAKSQLASVYLREGEDQKSLQLVEEVLTSNPNDQQALFNRGVLSQKRGNMSGAIADFRLLLKNQPNSVLALISLAKAHATNNEFDLAKTHLQKAISIAPKNPELHLEFAKVLASLKDKKSALESVNQSLILEADSLSASHVKVKILLSQADWPQAAKVAQQIQKVHASSSLGFNLLGQAYVGEKKYKLAISQFNKALGIAKDDLKALKGLLGIRFANKNYVDALKDTRQYLTNNPSNYVANNFLGDIYLAQRKIDLAEKAFLKAQKILPEAPSAYRSLARIYIFQKQPEKALKMLESGAKRTAQNFSLLLDLASLYENDDNTLEAIKVYDAILEKRPGLAQAVNNLAMLLLRQNQPADIGRAYELVKTIESMQNPFYQDTVGWVKFKKGDLDLALQHIRVAAVAVPDNAEINYHLGMVYQKRGNTALAKKYLQTALSFGQDFLGKQEAESTLATL